MKAKVAWASFLAVLALAATVRAEPPSARGLRALQASVQDLEKRVAAQGAQLSTIQMGLRVEPSRTSPNLIGGNPGNSVADGVVGATISGGGAADNPWDPDGGFNKVTGDYGFVGGGWWNIAANRAVAAGGWNNRATAEDAIVAGGGDNKATARQAVVAGGGDNRAHGEISFVAGGCSNTTGADAYASFAAGEDAYASRRGTFVWSAADDTGLDGVADTLDDHIFEEDGFPQTADKDSIPNPLLKDMQFWVKAPGGVFFVTGKDADGAPEGLMLRPGSDAWESINTAYHHGLSAADSKCGSGPIATGGAAPSPLQTLQGTVLDLEKRLAAQQEELTASRAESAALRARLEDLALRQAELRRLLAGEPRHGGELADADRSDLAAH